MKVIDASVLVQALGQTRETAAVAELLAEDVDLHAPHLVDVEVTSALRSLVRRGEISEDRARDARIDLGELALTRYPHGALLDRAWELRHSLSTYGAVYVALAELLDAPLLTSDARTARATGHSAKIELI